MQMVNFGLAERHLRLPHSQMNGIPWSVLQKIQTSTIFFIFSRNVENQ